MLGGVHIWERQHRQPTRISRRLRGLLGPVPGRDCCGEPARVRLPHQPRDRGAGAVPGDTVLPVSCFSCCCLALHELSELVSCQLEQRDNVQLPAVRVASSSSCQQLRALCCCIISFRPFPAAARPWPFCGSRPPLWTNSLPRASSTPGSGRPCRRAAQMDRLFCSVQLRLSQPCVCRNMLALGSLASLAQRTCPLQEPVERRARQLEIQGPSWRAPSGAHAAQTAPTAEKMSGILGRSSSKANLLSQPQTCPHHVQPLPHCLPPGLPPSAGRSARGPAGAALLAARARAHL